MEAATKVRRELRKKNDIGIEPLLLRSKFDSVYAFTSLQSSSEGIVRCFLYAAPRSDVGAEKGRGKREGRGRLKVRMKMEDMPKRDSHLLRLLLGQHLGAGDERNERDEKEREASHVFFVS